MCLVGGTESLIMNWYRNIDRSKVQFDFLVRSNILKQKEWDIIHVHGNTAMYIMPLKLAKRFGYKRRIMHSHNVKPKKNLFSIVHEIN